MLQSGSMRYAIVDIMQQLDAKRVIGVILKIHLF